ncbi:MULTISPECIES: hypothetical protein [Streptomyces]|uniref:Uncharacterized protein n=1 Tax=Streptomyces chengmaiensis TaxID=3040919 RepID=A0ABT6HSG0_9ACTN|nr:MULTISPECIES: hypothetical protein [Streptomyces]MDH2390814.1 hypothetical protein [Streptomyces chengmaiensis]WRQ80131.1 hypothetical protein I3F59_012645 [Streptomyces sp. MUM 178J]
MVFSHAKSFLPPSSMAGFGGAGDCAITVSTSGYPLSASKVTSTLAAMARTELEHDRKSAAPVKALSPG